MSTKTCCLCLQLTEDALSDHEIISTLRKIPELCIPDICDVTIKNEDKFQGSIILALSKFGGHVLVRCYENGFVTVDVQKLFLNNNENPVVDDITVIKDIETKLRAHIGLKCRFIRSVLGQIKRGELCPYFLNGKELLREVEGLSLVFEKDSKWQNIKIYNTKELGNFLCLEDDIMIGESDLIYTHTLLGVDRNDFRGKSVLILGGGDGGLLYELLKLSVGFVDMVEIDDEVIKACRKHMPKVCYEALDQYEGPHHRIHIGDCMDFLRSCLELNTKYDYIINDLTEYLVDKNGGTSMEYDYKISNTIIDYAFQLLKSGGKYLSRGNTLSAEYYRKCFEEKLSSLSLNFATYTIDVPSFNEPYCIYEVWK